MSLSGLIFSKSAEQLMELAYETLAEASTCSKQCAAQLFYAVRNVFELFVSVSFTFHRQNIESLPQVAGESMLQVAPH